jgi:hypothetical protein
MAQDDPPRTLKPQERKDGTWFVKAERPDRATQHIGDFKSEAEARNWITCESAGYFASLGYLL